eukprot:CAMPEP_0113824760 /NCGR_PEP_ID=MMETSP0328-20130328/3406_1 /TAXON_ID=39455 /ORGANISM="Alexandrium minutum" /LENGTH=143 /DNA_ID=CAMNT_0000792705 /DNA_START=142 /DNA_END=573 /DNA_ORIENTATION=- /assembly_acc=CAM_ASM_000350
MPASSSAEQMDAVTKAKAFQKVTNHSHQTPPSMYLSWARSQPSNARRRQMLQLSRGQPRNQTNLPTTRCKALTCCLTGCSTTSSLCISMTQTSDISDMLNDSVANMKRWEMWAGGSVMVKYMSVLIKANAQNAHPDLHATKGL